MKTILFILPFLLISNSILLATAQYPDKIIYEGKEYILHANPMEEYFEKYPNKRPEGGILSSALWRGYVATYIVKENELYLKDIEIEIPDKESKKSYDTKWKSVIKDLVKDGEELKIDWVTGILVIPHGKIKEYVHMGYASIYSKYILLEIEEGNVNKSKKLRYKEYVRFKKKQFEAFKKTKKYKELFEELKNKYDDDKLLETFLKNYTIKYTTKFIE